MNSISGARSWRLVYNELTLDVIAIIDTSGVTSTTFTIIEFETKDLLDQFVIDNNLKLPPLQAVLELI